MIEGTRLKVKGGALRPDQRSRIKDQKDKIEDPRSMIEVRKIHRERRGHAGKDWI
jgi:hypothetical protein